MNSPRSFRVTELAKELARQGHEVTVVTPKDDDVHEVFAMEHRVIIKDLGTMRWKSLDFGKSKLGYLLNRASWRFLNLALEYPDLELIFKVPKAIKGEQGYDKLISIAVPYPIHWGVGRVWKKNQHIAKTWIADCGDPYMGCTTDSFRKWFHFKYVEKWFMRKADFITIPIKSAMKAYYPEFHPKIKIISQGFKIDPHHINEAYKPNPIPTFAYAGGFIPGRRDPRPFLDYLVHHNVAFKFYVFTNNRAIVATHKAILKDKLVVCDYIPREELLLFLGKMDFLVNFDNNTETAIPSKLIDYAIVGRPVLNIKKSLESKSIDAFLQGEYSDPMVLPDIESFRIENVAQAFLELGEEGNL